MLARESFAILPGNEDSLLVFSFRRVKFHSDKRAVHWWRALHGWSKRFSLCQCAYLLITPNQRHLNREPEASVVVFLSEDLGSESSHSRSSSPLRKFLFSALSFVKMMYVLVSVLESSVLRIISKNDAPCYFTIDPKRGYSGKDMSHNS